MSQKDQTRGNLKINHTDLSRLCFIKYLFQIGVKQSNLSHPQNCTSILMFHDSIDLFLQLSAEKLNVKTKGSKMYFMDYINTINQNLASKQLQHRESMKNLNDARITIKHKGLLIAETDIERFRVNSKDFFEDDTPIIFGMEFSDISMIELIKNSEVRKILYDALEFSKNKQYKEALERIVIAFDKLISNYHYSIYDFDGIDESDFESEEGDFSSGIEKLNEILENMQLTLKLLSLKINNTNYMKFRLLTPTLYRGKDIYDKYSVHWFLINKIELKQEHYDFCLDFVIDCAQKLHEFYSEMDHLQLMESDFKYL